MHGKKNLKKWLDMESFLHECKQNLKNSNASSKVRVVLGNEACDLDSAVSALVMAYFIHKMHSPAILSVPVLNVVRKDLALRNEVVFFLEETHIPINSLICLDEINLKDLSESENFTVTLVDHNLLSDEQTYLESKVVQIIDHHSVDRAERLENIDSHIEEAGSCSSLVADIIFNSNEALMDPQVAMLLYGTIILDTVCLQESAKRVKEIDRKMVSKLEPYLEGISREEIFGTLRKVKFDVSNTLTAPAHMIESDNMVTLSNGFQHDNNTLNYSEDTIPTYKAEAVDFPESPKVSKFLDITVELQNLKSDEDLIGNALEPEEIKLENGCKVTEGTGTLKRISVRGALSKNEDIDEDQRSLSSLSNKSDLDVFSATDDIIIPDDVDTLDELENSDCDYMESPMSDPIPEMSAAEELEEKRSWKSCHVNGEERRIDMKVIEPYRKVLSHGGYQEDATNLHAIIIFSACYLPDRCRKDYDYVMDNLFLYVITTLNELVAEDYVLVYLHGATERSNMPSFRWLKRCYQMIDRRLRKNLKGLYLVHPTFWLKTIVIMTKPFISSKFSRKLQFVYSLQELSSLIPLDQVSIPDKVKQFDEDLFPD